jgi:hypothetical protein
MIKNDDDLWTLVFQGNTPRIQALKSQDKELAKYLESKFNWCNSGVGISLVEMEGEIACDLPSLLPLSFFRFIRTF